METLNAACNSTKPPARGEIAEEVRLRPASPADADLLALVGAATFLEAFTWMLPGVDIAAHCAKNHTPDAYRACFAHPKTRITLAVTGQDAPVGYAMLCQPELPSIATFPADIELKRIYLFSRFRLAEIDGVRAGQALMNAAIADAHALGCGRLLLGTHENNLRAISFYRRNGFRDAGKRTFIVGSQQCCDLILSRDL